MIKLKLSYLRFIGVFMKKKSLCFMILIVFASIVFAQSRLENELSKIIPNSIPNKQYIVKNPILIDVFFVTDLEKLAGKIIKTTLHKYITDKDGKIYLAEEEGDKCETKYFKFSKEGVIESIYTINIEQVKDVRLEEREIQSFSYTNSSIVENILKTKIIKGKPAKIDESTIYHNVFYNNGEIKIEKCGSLKQDLLFSNKNGQFCIKQENTFLNFNVNKIESITKNSNDRIIYKNFYENGLLHETVQFNDNGSIYKRTFLKKGKIKNEYYDADGNSKNLVSECYEISFDPIGFLKSKKTFPNKGVSGRHTDYFSVILDSFDEEFSVSFEN